MRFGAIDIAGVRAVALIVALAFGGRAWLAFLPESELVKRILPDDAFYYFQIARNITSGDGVSFDGNVTTNGFHPLWMLIVTAAYALPIADEAALRIALLAGAAIGAAGCIPIYRMLRRHTDAEGWALLGAGLYALTPAAIMFSVNGLESSLVMTAFLFALDAADDVLQRDDGPRRSLLLLGAWLGVMMLARTDYAIVAAAILGVIAVVRGFAPAMKAAGIAALVVVPWLVWSLLAAGSIVQSSGEAVPLVAHGNGPDGFDAVRHGATAIRDAWLQRVPQWYFGAPSLRPLGVAMMVVAAVASVALAAATRLTRAFGLLLCGAGLGLVALTVAHAGVRWYFREWYVMPLVGFVLVACIVAIQLLREPMRLPAAALFVAVWAVLGVSFVAHQVRDPQYEIQADIFAAARWIEHNTDDSTVTGSLNAGIVGYYSGRETVNLDGVVDPDALDAVRDKQLIAYLEERCVAQIAEFPFYLFYYDAYWGGRIGERLTVAAAFDEAIHRQPASIANAFTVWEITPAFAGC